MSAAKGAYSALTHQPSAVLTASSQTALDVRSSGVCSSMHLFAISGFIVATVFGTTIATHWHQKVLTSQWLAIGVAVPLYIIVYGIAWLPSRATIWTPQISNTLRFVLCCVYIATGLGLAAVAHRYFYLLFPLIESLLLYTLLRAHKIRLPAIALAVATFVSWIAAVPLSYTALSNLLLDAATSSNFVLVAFVGALLLAVFDLIDYAPVTIRKSKGRAALLLALVGIGALELALRSDGLLTDWIPYHRSYFTEPATLVRLGHWLLWDIPSQYGFLSVLAIALTPGKTTWQSSYVLTAAILAFECILYYSMLRSRGGGLQNAIFAVALPAATFLGDQAYRYPFGPRVYPQHGIRFIWIYCLLFVVFRLSEVTSGAARRLWTVAGFAAWALGCMWAFESAIWSTLIWGTYVGATALLRASNERTIKTRLVAAVPFLVLPATLIICVAFIDAFYAMRLSHLPDWRAYAEFSAVYLGAAPNSPTTDLVGPGWLLLMLLGSVAAPLLVAVRQRTWSALPALAACWIATWSTSVYFAGETFANHVNALVGVFGFAFAIIAMVTRTERLAVGPILLARASFVPVSVILMATSFGNGGSILKVHAPFFPGYQFDQAERIAPISGELAELMRRAGVRPGDKVVLPDEIGWVKLDVGLIMPFVREADGSEREIEPWLPVGPGGGFGMYDTLTPDRRLVYLERFLQVGRETGWLITYHQRASCSEMAPRTTNRGDWQSVNFNATRCVFGDR